MAIIAKLNKVHQGVAYIRFYDDSDETTIIDQQDFPYTSDNQETFVSDVQKKITEITARTTIAKTEIESLLTTINTEVVAAAEAAVEAANAETVKNTITVESTTTEG